MSKDDLKQQLKSKKLEDIKIKKDYLDGIRNNILKSGLNKPIYKNPLCDNRITWAKRKIIKKTNNFEDVEIIQSELLGKRSKVKKI